MRGFWVLGVLESWKRQLTQLGDRGELPKLWDWYKGPVEGKSKISEDLAKTVKK